MIWSSRKRSGNTAVVIDLARGVREGSLADTLAGVIRTNTERDAKKQEKFGAMRGAIAVIADDEGEAFTLRFDFGRLVVHDGLIGVPDVTVRGTASSIRGLADLPYPSWVGAGIGVLASRQLREALGASLGALRSGELKFYGGIVHFPLIVALLRVVSKNAPGIAVF